MSKDLSRATMFDFLFMGADFIFSLGKSCKEIRRKVDLGETIWFLDKNVQV